MTREQRRLKQDYEELCKEMCFQRDANSALLEKLDVEFSQRREMIEKSAKYGRDVLRLTERLKKLKKAHENSEQMIQTLQDQHNRDVLILEKIRTESSQRLHRVQDLQEQLRETQSELAEARFEVNNLSSEKENFRIQLIDWNEFVNFAQQGLPRFPLPPLAQKFIGSDRTLFNDEYVCVIFSDFPALIFIF